MVAEAWFLKIRNQVSANIKQALVLESSSSRKHVPKKHVDKKVVETIGILSFEVANVMSKTIHLYKSLSDSEITKLRNEILNSEGVRRLVSSEEGYLVELVKGEKLDELNRVAGVVSRLGKKCSVPALQGFEHVYGDIVSGVIDVKELGFLVKHMEGMVRKMDRYVSATRGLYSKMGVLNELEQTVKKFRNDNRNEESRRGYEQRLVWQKQDVRHLKEISLWNQSFDKVVELLARTVCTLYARICMVFSESTEKKFSLGFGNCEGSPLVRNECRSASGLINVDVNLEKLKRNHSKKNSFHLNSIGRNGGSRNHIDVKRGELAYVQLEDFGFPCGTSPGRLFMECLSLSSSVSAYDDFDDVVIDREDQYSCVSSSQSPIEIGSIVKKKAQMCSNFSPNSGSSVVYAPPSTLGGCALALHYANIVIVIEKLLSFPHLIGDEARDYLYKMLPTSLRLSLKAKLKIYVKDLAIYDAPLAHEWKATLDGILRWLSPLAHNMMKWQSERNFEQHEIVSQTNVLLFQTLYFADKCKTEEAICELLLGMNYICRYEQQQNALLGCASSFNFEDMMKWKLQRGTSLLD
ncbi:uncharacterized protein LOC131618486 [Vicia villosa]|uniref:uncharacterized protein LOC131618486 n=1 Tax=Vicia villosa TaxID=3911 RepID=UPI00273CA6BF|nr:uncharacterized protein LOC131618486 [Vicia villosa]